MLWTLLTRLALEESEAACVSSILSALLCCLSPVCEHFLGLNPSPARGHDLYRGGWSWAGNPPTEIYVNMFMITLKYFMLLLCPSLEELLKSTWNSFYCHNVQCEGKCYAGFWNNVHWCFVQNMSNNVYSQSKQSQFWFHVDLKMPAWCTLRVRMVNLSRATTLSKFFSSISFMYIS